ncbi:MAG: metal-dependent hydrolase [Haloarculaceae archaeon]
MPSTLVHVAFGGLIAAPLLASDFDRRAALVVFAATAVPDLDAFVGLFFTAGHRTVGHTLVFPALLAVLLLADTQYRSDSAIRSRWGDRGVRIAWVSLLSLTVAGIGLDLFTGGANPLWPIHDQFYRITGKIEISNTRGIVQTFVDVNPRTGTVHAKSFGTSKQVHVSTGVNPTKGKETGPLVDVGGGGGGGGESEPKIIERVFPVVRSGWQLLLLLTGSAVTAVHVRRVEREKASE